MNLYEALKTKTGGREAATVQDIIEADLGFADAESIYAAAAKDSRLQHDPDAGRVRINPDYKPAPAKPKTKPTTKRGAVVTTGFTQNNHAWRMRSDLDAYDFGVAMQLHMFCYAPKNHGKAQMALSRLADECKLSEDAVKPRLKRLVERGWFIRVDNGKGGRNKNNVATYKASMPAWAAPG